MIYSDGARERLRQLGFERIHSFLESAPAKSAKAVLAYIRVPGFRRGSGGEFERQKRILAHRIAGVGADKPTVARDWEAARGIWAAWSRANIRSDDLATDILEFSDDGEEARNALVQRFHDLCLDLASRKAISREILATFLQFAPFDTTTFSDAMSLAPTVEEFEAASAVLELPRTVSRLDEDVLGLKQAMNSLTHAISGIRARTEGLPDFEAYIRRSDEELARLIGRIESASLAVDALQISVAENIRTRKDDREATGAVLKRDDTRAGEIVALREDLQQLSNDLSARVGVLEVGATRVDQPPPPETRPLSSEGRALTPRREEVAQSSVVTARPAESLHDASLGAATLATLDSARVHLQRNLTSMGLAPSRAGQIAREILAAVATGQQVSFAGSLANVAARVCALSIAADRWASVDVPMGLTDSSLVPETNAALGLLIMNNVNIGSYDLFAIEIRRTIVAAQISKRSNIQPIFLATLARGPIALPISPEYCELGPVIDTDLLEWGSASFSRPLQMGYASFGAQPRQEYDEAHELQGDLCRDLAHILVGQTVLWGKMVGNAISAALAMGLEEAPGNLTIEVSVLAGWIIPYAVALGASKKSIREAIAASSTLSSLAAEPRIVALLSQRL